MHDVLPQHQLISDASSLARLAEIARSVPWIALDTESNSFFSYPERVCLIQLNLDGALYLIDPLALAGDGPNATSHPSPNGSLAGADLFPAPLREVLEGGKIPVFLHGGEYDVAVLKREFNLALGGVFDTQQAATFLGWERTGYQTVVQRVCDVHLPKAHTQYDWGQRPLGEEAIRYALDDVLHLPTVAAFLSTAIAAVDLREELALANAAVMASPAHQTLHDPAQIHRIKGVGALPPPALARLVALHSWRDALARSRNFPPGRMVPNAALINLARDNPGRPAALRRVGIRPRLLREIEASLLECLRGADDSPPPIPPATARARPSRQEARREGALKKWRREEADLRSVPLQVVLPARALAHLAKMGASALAAVPELGEKRRKRYGVTLASLCDGPSDA